MNLPEQPKLTFILSYNEALMTEYGQACYQAGRESMRIECLQECSAEATDNGTAQRIAKAIEELE